ncbi:MAG: hypothetical protein R2850_13255 [Bacteroidia bacterium]
MADHPYITYENAYIESVWYLLSELYNKNLIYKGYTIQLLFACGEQGSALTS